MLKVIIVGAGSAGLLLAQGLQHSGIACEIYERDTEERFKYGQREWGMSMHWGGEYLARTLPPDLFAKLREIEADPFHDASKDTGFTICNGKTGEVIFLQPGTMPRRVSRRKLRKLLMTGINIQYSKSITSFDIVSGKVVVRFSDGSDTEGSLLIGCDGSKSRVREILVGREASTLKEADITMLNFPYTYSAEEAHILRAIHPVFKVSYHPDLRNTMYLLCILDVQDPDKPETWKFQNLMSWKGPPYPEDLKDPVERIRFFKSRGAQFTDPWRTAALGVSDDTIVSVDPGGYLEPPEGIEQHSIVTLAGDAAHTMLPHRGQGLNNALQDAFELVEALRAVEAKKKTLEDAVSNYAKEMIPRGRLEVQVSQKQAIMAHDWDQLMQSPMFKFGAHKATISEVDPVATVTAST